MNTQRNRSSGRPTLDQVATRAGVGRGHCLPGGERLGAGQPAARAGGGGAIAELDYAPNRAARALVTQRTDSIALVVFESGERFFAEPFFGRIVQAVSSVLVGRDLQMVLMIAQSPHERRRLEGYLTRQHVDGALLLSLHGADPLPASWSERGVPTVQAGRPTLPIAVLRGRGQPGRRAEAVGYLRDLGRRRIATITGPLDMAAGIARLDGYRDVAGAGPVRGRRLQRGERRRRDAPAAGAGARTSTRSSPPRT